MALVADFAIPLAAASTAERGPLIGEDVDLPAFDPAIHLAFRPPAQRHSFKDLGLPKPQNAPDLCYTDPFPLFSEEGVRMLRREILNKRILDNYLRSWDRAPAYIAGHEKVGLCFSFAGRCGTTDDLTVQKGSNIYAAGMATPTHSSCHRQSSRFSCATSE